jgi:hypothetical protein
MLVTLPPDPHAVVAAHSGVRYRTSVKWTLAAVVWLVLFALLLYRNDSFANDHFGRISPGRQILVYGEHPFADFRDPGYFLTLYVSAAAQAVTGGSLAGEAVITSAAIAAAGALTFWLAESASGSFVIGFIAAYVTLLVSPRAYDYDKVLFYMSGLALAWRYADSPTRGRLAAAGVCTSLAGLFRYDNGLFVMVACAATILVRRWRDPYRMLPDGAVYLAAVLAVAAPALIFVQSTAGLQEAFRQITTYAAQEGHRSGLFKVHSLSLDRVSVSYALIVATVPVALLHLLLLRRRGHGALRFAGSKILAGALLLSCVIVFILRDSLDSRIGAAVPLAAVLAASIAGQWRSNDRAADTHPRRSLAARVGMLLLATATVAGVFVQVVGLRLLVEPSTVVEDFADIPRAFGPPRPGARYYRDSPVARYLAACTPPEARVFINWFDPQVPFFAQRGFAGGMAFVFGSHWSSDADQRRTIEQMESQKVPVVIIRAASDELTPYARLVAYLNERYREGGATSFGVPGGDPRAFRILIKRDLGDVPTDPQWMLPCPFPQGAVGS